MVEGVGKDHARSYQLVSRVAGTSGARAPAPPCGGVGWVGWVGGVGGVWFGGLVWLVVWVGVVWLWVGW